MDVVVGQQVGWKHAKDERITEGGAGKTIVQFLTEGRPIDSEVKISIPNFANHRGYLLGTLLAYAKRDPTLQAFRVVIVDEAHERTTEVDQLLAILKEACLSNKKLKAIIMSATLDTRTFQSYLPGAPLLNVEGRTFDVDVFYWESTDRTKTPESKIMALDTVEMIYCTKPEGDILVFVDGAPEASELADNIYERLERYEGGAFGSYSICCLYSRLDAADQALAFERGPVSSPGAPGRKIVVATNVAETSLTIDGIVYVVDTGLAKTKVFNPWDGITTFESTQISQAEANQRKGRGGRTKKGYCYRLYNETAFRSFAAQAPPKLLMGNLSGVVLNVLIMGKNPLFFDYPTAPAPESMAHALEELYFLGFVTRSGSSGYKVTSLGKHASRLPLEPHLAAMCIASESSSKSLHCGSEILTIAAMLQAISSGPLWNPCRQKGDAEIKKACIERWKHPTGDHISLFHIFRNWKLARQRGESRTWCSGEWLKEATLRSADRERQKLVQKMKQIFPKFEDKPMELDDPLYHVKIGRALCHGFFMRAGMVTTPAKVPPPPPRGEKKKPATPPKFTSVRNSVEFKLDRKAALNLNWKLKYQWIIFDEINHTNKGNVVTTATSVAVEWLIEANDKYFDVDIIPVEAIRDNVLSAYSKMRNLVEPSQR